MNQPTRFPSKHRIKSHTESFIAVWSGVKGHETRLNDRKYKVADSVRLSEYDPEKGAFSGRSIDLIIVHLRFAEGEGFPVSPGLKSGYVIFDFLIICRYTKRGTPAGDSEPFHPEVDA